MNSDEWVTLIVVGLVLYALVRDSTSPVVAVFGGNVVLLVLGVIDVNESLSGFSNSGPITVAALYVLAAGVDKTGALSPLMQSTLGEGRHIRRLLARLLAPVALVSGFLNNTPLVAMLAPQVTAWTERRGLSPSKFLMPLSFATILGGVTTVIGTSTNLIVSGQMRAAGLEEMRFFEIGWVGVPVAVLGTATIVLLTPWVLPDRRSPRSGLVLEEKRFTLEMEVEPGGPLDGQSVERAGLRHLAGVFLASVQLGDTTVAPVGPQTILQGGSRLRFAGRADDILDLRSKRGLRTAAHEHVQDLSHNVRYFEVVIGEASPLLGRTLKETGFRARYQAAVIAIHRAGHLVDAKLGGVQLRVGDTLIVMSNASFRSQWRDRPDFLLVSEMDATPLTTSTNARVVGALLVGFVVLASLGLVPVLQGSLVAALLLIALRILSPDEARRSIDLDVIGIIAAAFGLAAAIESSGLADRIASGLVATFQGLGPTGILLGIIIATVALTELITNNAAALLMFPIGIATAEAAGCNPRAFAIAVTIAASASFLTPIGYQTNTMVYGPGGYRFGDYIRLGFPLTIIVIVTCVIVIPIMWPL